MVPASPKPSPKWHQMTLPEKRVSSMEYHFSWQLVNYSRGEWHPIVHLNSKLICIYPCVTQKTDDKYPSQACEKEQKRGC